MVDRHANSGYQMTAYQPTNRWDKTQTRTHGNVICPLCGHISWIFIGNLFKNCRGFTMICLTSPRIPMMIPEFPISAGCSKAPSLKGGKPVKIHCREGDVLCILAAAQKGQLSNQLPKCNVSPPRMVSQNPGTLVNPQDSS
jgi:hypothetical protein